MTDPKVPIELAPEYSKAIGYVAIAWSAVEYHINLAIWELAGVPSGVGACMTAQIYTFDGRMKALIALLNLKRVPPSIIKDANRFHEDTRGPQEIRNRVIHDYWVWDAAGAIHRLEMTASKKLKLEAVPVSLDELNQHYETMKQMVDRAAELKAKIYAALPSLPEIPQSELQPITDRRSDQ